MPRLKSSIVVSAIRRTCDSRAIPCMIVKRGADEGGAIYVEVDRLDGRLEIYAPAPIFDTDDRAWMAVFSDGCDREKALRYFDRIRDDDPDAWILAIEDREGRHGLDPVVEV